MFHCSNDLTQTLIDMFSDEVQAILETWSQALPLEHRDATLERPHTPNINIWIWNRCRQQLLCNSSPQKTYLSLKTSRSRACLRRSMARLATSQRANAGEQVNHPV